MYCKEEDGRNVKVNISVNYGQTWTFPWLYVFGIGIKFQMVTTYTVASCARTFYLKSSLFQKKLQALGICDWDTEAVQSFITVFKKKLYFLSHINPHIITRINNSKFSAIENLVFWSLQLIKWTPCLRPGTQHWFNRST